MGRICIVGLGLMGGSLALALRENATARSLPVGHDIANGLQASAYGTRHVHIIGVSRSRTTLEAAQAAGAIDWGTTDLTNGISQADIVVLATPARTILQQLPKVGRHTQPGTLVLDLGSTKAEICAAMAKLPDDIEPVGGHPMCGKETGGFTAAEANLYRDKIFVLCPLRRTSDAALAQACGLVEAIGARPLLLDPTAHDKAAAAISHLPYTAAIALVNAVQEGDDPLVRSLAASGYRDTTRLAASDVDMMLDILLTNRAAVLDWLGIFQERLANLKAALMTGNETALRAQLAAAQTHRTNLKI